MGLSLKGIDLKKKKKKKHKKNKRKRDEPAEDEVPQQAEQIMYREEEEEDVDREDLLTDAERRYHKKMKEREVEMARNATAKTYREKIEDYNARLASMTEHNDIP